MADLERNGIDDDLEAKAYKAQAVNAKFKQQISYGIGAAMVFGLVSAIAASLFKAATVGSAVVAGSSAAPAAAIATGFALAPTLGLVALGIAGVGLLYLSAKFLSENTVLDQALQAKQIAASQGKAPSVEPVIEKTNQFPATAFADKQTAAEVTLDAPAFSGSALPQTATLERAKSEPMIARAAANENLLDNASSWQDKITSAPATEQARA